MQLLFLSIVININFKNTALVSCLHKGGFPMFADPPALQLLSIFHV